MTPEEAETLAREYLQSRLPAPGRDGVVAALKFRAGAKIDPSHSDPIPRSLAEAKASGAKLRWVLTGHKSEELAEQAKSDPVARDALAELAIELVNRGEPTPEPLRPFVTTAIAAAAKVERAGGSRKRGRQSADTWFTKLTLAFAVDRLIERGAPAEVAYKAVANVAKAVTRHLPKEQQIDKNSEAIRRLYRQMIGDE